MINPSIGSYNGLIHAFTLRHLIHPIQRTGLLMPACQFHLDVSISDGIKGNRRGAPT